METKNLEWKIEIFNLKVEEMEKECNLYMGINKKNLPENIKNRIYSLLNEASFLDNEIITVEQLSHLELCN